MRQVYRLLGLVKKWGSGRVELACRRALEAEAVDVNLVEPHAGAGTRGHRRSPCRRAPVVIQGRFARDAVGVRRDQGGGTVTAPAPSVSPELRSLMRTLKLGRLLDTLPERLALGAQSRARPRRVLGAAVLRRGPAP